MPKPHIPVPRSVARRVAVVLIAAVIAGTVFVLGISAALDADWDSQGAVMLAIAAVWIPQALITAARHRRR